MGDFTPYMVNIFAWITFFVIWFLAARFVRRTKWSESTLGRLQYTLLLAFGCFLMMHDPRRHLIYGALYHSRIIAWIGSAMTIGGFALAIWARFTLGRNWSGNVTLKQDHELVRSGPYRFARHPLYTGFLTALLGTAVTAGTGDAMIGFALCLLSCLIKMRKEETVMLQEFGDAYRQFKKEVPALVPFVY